MMTVNDKCYITVLPDCNHTYNKNLANLIFYSFLQKVFFIAVILNAAFRRFTP